VEKGVVQIKTNYGQTKHIVPRNEILLLFKKEQKIAILNRLNKLENRIFFLNEGKNIPKDFKERLFFTE